MATTGNIVQAEFLLIPKDTAHPDEFFAEWHERLASGAATKVTVRFYDRDGRIQTRTETMHRTSRMHDEYRHRYAHARGLLAASLSLQVRFLAGKSIRLQREQLQECIAEVLKLLRAREPLALEQRNQSFRLVQADERYELEQQIKRASGVWCFIYENEYSRTPLCVQGTKMVAHAM